MDGRTTASHTSASIRAPVRGWAAHRLPILWLSRILSAEETWRRGDCDPDHRRVHVGLWRSLFASRLGWSLPDWRRPAGWLPWGRADVGGASHGQPMRPLSAEFP